MKFNILNYSQRVAISYGFDLKDIHILSWLQDFYPKMKKMIIDSEEYAWVNYQSFVEDMPILQLKKDSLYRRLKHLEETGFLKHKSIKNENGSFSYFKITNMILKLLEDDFEGVRIQIRTPRTDSNPNGTDSNPNRVRIEIPTKDNPTRNNPSTISFLSFSQSEKKEKLKKIWKEKELKSDMEKYFLFREKSNWKGVAKLEADCLWWENGFLEKNKPKMQRLSVVTAKIKKEDKEIAEIMSKIKFELGKINKREACQFFKTDDIFKIDNQFLIKIKNKKALEFEPILKKIGLRIEKQI